CDGERRRSIRERPRCQLGAARWQRDWNEPHGSGPGGKRLELLKEILPRLSRAAVIWNAANPYSALVFEETRGAAKTLAIEVQSMEVRGPGDFDVVLDTAVRKRADALVTVEDPLTFNHRKQIVEWCAENRLPAMYGLREYADAGGLVTYGASL